MTDTTPRAKPSRRDALFTLAGSAGVLMAGCGGGGGGSNDGTATIRAVNLSSDIAAADLLFNDTAQFTSLAADALSDNKTVNGQDWTVKLRATGDTTTLLSGSYSLGKDKHYTAVIWGRATSPRLSTLPEDEDEGAIASGTSRLRVFNATLETGSVDVYVTAASANLAETAASISSVTAGQLSSFRDLPNGTFRLRVTGAGNPNDVRLDIASIVLNEKKYATLVLTPGASGVLVNGRTIQQQGASSSQVNTKARLRVVAAADSSGTVGVTVGTAVLASGLRSPSIGPYQLIDSGSQLVTARINGNVVSSINRNIVAGNDYTLMTYGNGTVVLLIDDNRLPALATSVKMRLVHGAAGVEPLTLSVDFLPLVGATNVAAGTASAYAVLTATTSSLVDVSGNTSVYSASAVALQAQSIYTVFVLGGNATPTGVIRKER